MLGCWNERYAGIKKGQIGWIPSELGMNDGQKSEVHEDAESVFNLG